MKDYNKILLLFLIVFFCTPTFSNELCLSNAINGENEYRKSDFVFLGKVSDFDTKNNSFQFEILDVYKGFYPLNKISIEFVYSNGDIAPELGQINGYWIIYAQRKGLNSATVKICGASRNLQRQTIQQNIAPPPEFFNSKKDSLEYYNLKEKLVIESQKEWINEIMVLEEKKKDWNIIVLSGILLISITLNIVFLIKLKKKPVANNCYNK